MMSWFDAMSPAALFDMPWLLSLVPLLPLGAWWLRTARTRRRQERLEQFAQRSALARLLQPDRTNTAARTARLVGVALFAALAFAGPRWGAARGPVTTNGIDMAIALDASLSMTAPDDRPSRLERMKQEVRRLRAMSRADRVALIAFAGRSYILTPLTSDDGALELYLDNLDPSVVGQAGTSMSRAIRQGTELLLASDGSADRALVLMSDGESFEPLEDLKAASEEAGAKGVSVVTVGFGTLAGSTIPVRDGSVVREKRDQDGNIVITKYNPELLAAAATAAGGTFIPAEASDKASRIRTALRGLRAARRKVETREDRVPRFDWMLFPALVLLLYDTWLTTRGNNARPLQPIVAPASPAPASTVPASAMPASTAALALLCVFASGALMTACTREPDPAALFEQGDVRGALAALQRAVANGDTAAATRYNLGTVLLASDSLKPSVELLEALRRVAYAETRMRSRFNAGLGELRLGRDTANPEAEASLAAARAAYRTYLGDRAGDVDAKWNYELALRNPPPNGGGGGGGGGQNDKNPEQPEPQPQGGIDQRQAEALLNSAAREERDVQGKRQKQGQLPPNGKDW